MSGAGSIHEAAREAELSLATLEIHQDCLAGAPTVRSVLIERQPWIADAIDSLRRAAIVPPTLGPFERGAFVRPVTHNRCFYYAHEQGVIALKGFEPLSPEFASYIDSHRHDGIAPDWPGSTQRWKYEHFAVMEHKVPYVLRMDEAEAETAKALAFQSKHLEAYGDLAHVPVPLAIFALPQDVTRHAREVARRNLSPVSAARLGLDLVEIGAYAYYYPHVPKRLRIAAHELPQGAALRWQALHEQYDRDQLLDRWMQLFCRILCLGYLPASVATISTGSCVDPNNIVMDGGFVDYDSLQPMAAIPDEITFHDDLWFSFAGLCYSLRYLLVGPIPYRVPPDAIWWQICSLARRLVRERVDREKVGALDPRLEAWLTDATSFDDLGRWLAAYRFQA